MIIENVGTGQSSLRIETSTVNYSNDITLNVYVFVMLIVFDWIMNMSNYCYRKMLVNSELCTPH